MKQLELIFTMIVLTFVTILTIGMIDTMRDTDLKNDVVKPIVQYNMRYEK